MYRTAGAAPPNDSRLIVPGEGLRDILVGRATPRDVLAVFGTDAQVNRHSDGNVFQISYEYDAAGEYAPRRDPQAERPAQFHFEYGLLKAIGVGVYQSELYTSHGIRIGSTRDEVRAAFGADGESFVDSPVETLRYVRDGIQFGIHGDGCVASFVVFRAQRL
jgi:hypothetical protein